jgi:hypothetical protein
MATTASNMGSESSHGKASALIAYYWLRVFLFLAREEQREEAGFEEMQC